MNSETPLDKTIDKISIARSPAEGVKLILQLEMGILEDKFSGEDVVGQMLEQLGRPNSAVLSGTWIVLKYLGEQGWDLLTEPQKKTFIDYLMFNYGRFSEWIGTQVASEILSERLPSNQALHFYREMTDVIQSIQSPQNSLIPYGIWRVIDSLDRMGGKNRAEMIAVALRTLQGMLKIKDDSIQIETRRAIVNISESKPRVE